MPNDIILQPSYHRFADEGLMVGGKNSLGSQLKQVTSMKLLLLHSSTRPQGLLVYLLVNSILKIMVHLQVLYSELEDQQVAPPT